MVEANSNGARVKGVSFRSVLHAITTLRGDEFARKCRTQLSPALAETFQYEVLLATSWYPIQWYRELLESIRATAGTEQVLFQVGRQCMLQDTKGVYRRVFHLLSPQTVLRTCPRVFNNYYDTGTCTVVATESEFAEARWSGCTGFDRNMWCEVLGAAEMLMELTGAQSVKVRLLAGGRDGDDYAEISCRWLPARQRAGSRSSELSDDA